MKRIFTLLSVSILITVTQNAFAQSKPDSRTKIITDSTFPAGSEFFSANQISHNKETKVTTFTGHVSFKTDKLEFADAGKVVFDKKTNKLVIYACKGFAFDGEVVIKDNTSKLNTVEYTLGEGKLYLL